MAERTHGGLRIPCSRAQPVLIYVYPCCPTISRNQRDYESRLDSDGGDILELRNRLIDFHRLTLPWMSKRASSTVVWIKIECSLVLTVCTFCVLYQYASGATVSNAKYFVWCSRAESLSWHGSVQDTKYEIQYNHSVKANEHSKPAPIMIGVRSRSQK